MAKKSSPKNPKIGKGGDFLKKEPTKTEKFLYELAMQQEQFQRNLNQVFKILNDINTRLVAFSRSKIEPDVLLPFYLDLKANEAYMARFNVLLDQAMAEKNKQNVPQPEAGSSPKSSSSEPELPPGKEVQPGSGEAPGKPV